MQKKTLFALMLVGVAVLVGCAPAGDAQVMAPPVVTASLTATVPAFPTATLTPPAPAPALAIITPADTPTPITPSATPTITDTPGPYEHVIQENDQLLSIVQDYGHYDLDVLDLIVAMNSNIPNADRLPPPGSTILIPRPSPSPTREGNELTATILARNPQTPTAEPPLTTHVVESGQTIIGLALEYNTTMLILRNLNPRLDWRGCNFEIPSGGDDCNPPLSIGQELVVPAPTLTPTLSPTPSGSETPTPTPTVRPLQLLWPSTGGIIAGGPLVLRWVGAGALADNELYQVTVTDQTLGIVYTEFTQDNTLVLPGDLQPTDEAAHEFVWRVGVVRVRPDNRAEIVGASSEERPFQWIAAP